MKEFVSMRPDKQGNTVANGQWASKPYLMLEKCALANVYRLAFPEWVAGMYIAEEMTGEERPIIDIEPVSEQEKTRRKRTSEAARITEEPCPETNIVPQNTLQLEKPVDKGEGVQLMHKPEPTYEPIKEEKPKLEVLPPVTRSLPKAEPLKAETKPRPSPIPPKRDALNAPVEQATKSRLWQLLLRAAEDKEIDSNFALGKLTSIPGGMTEDLCQKLIKNVEAKDYSFFQKTQQQQPSENDVAF
jgi:hypothetical protein